MADQTRHPSRVSSRRAVISPDPSRASGGSHIRPWCRREADRLASSDVQAGSSGGPCRPGSRRGKQQPVGSAPGGQAAGDGFENRVDQAVFGTRSVADLELRSAPSVQARRRSNAPRRPGTQVVAAVVAADRHGVGQHRRCRSPSGTWSPGAMVWSTYARLASKSPAGRIRKCPPSGSRMRANTALRVETRET